MDTTFSHADLGEINITRPGEQLSFDVGLPGNRPDFGSVKLTGALSVQRDIRRQEEVTVQVVDQDGQVICKSRAMCVGIMFKDKTDEYGTTTERIHTLSLGALG